MQIEFFNLLAHSDYCCHLYCYIHNILANVSLGLLLAFCVIIDCSNYIINNQVQVFSGSKYNLQYLPAVILVLKICEHHF